MHQRSGGLVRMTAHAFLNTVSPFAHSASLSLDVRMRSLHVISGVLTSNTAITLLNGADGCAGIVWLKQGAGNHSITSVTASGRTVLMAASLSTINTADFLAANAVSGLTYEYQTVAGTAYVLIGIVPMKAAAF